jgi:hypothetical protein
MHTGSLSRRFYAWALAPALLAIPLALFMAYAALEHNPQEEFCAYVSAHVSSNYISNGEPCRIKWRETGLIFAVWFGVQAVVFSIAHVLWKGRRSAP